MKRKEEDKERMSVKDKANMFIDSCYKDMQSKLNSNMNDAQSSRSSFRTTGSNGQQQQHVNCKSDGLHLKQSEFVSKINSLRVDDNNNNNNANDNGNKGIVTLKQYYSNLKEHNRSNNNNNIKHHDISNKELIDAINIVESANTLLKNKHQKHNTHLSSHEQQQQQLQHEDNNKQKHKSFFSSAFNCDTIERTTIIHK
jgi:hypothetical protein